MHESINVQDARSRLGMDAQQAWDAPGAPRGVPGVVPPASCRWSWRIIRVPRSSSQRGWGSRSVGWGARRAVRVYAPALMRVGCGGQVRAPRRLTAPRRTRTRSASSCTRSSAGRPAGPPCRARPPNGTPWAPPGLGAGEEGGDMVRGRGQASPVSRWGGAICLGASSAASAVAWTERPAASRGHEGVHQAKAGGAGNAE